MGQVGHFGKVKFRVNQTASGGLDILSFDNVKWNQSINVEHHKRRGQKPLTEFVDRNLDEMTMDIYLSAYFGVNPTEMLHQLRVYNRKCEPHYLIMGGKRVGSHRFIITNLSNALQQFYRNGRVVTIRTSATLEEYMDAKRKKRSNFEVVNKKPPAWFSLAKDYL